MTWLISSKRDVSFGGVGGEHGATERTQSAEWPKEILCGAGFDQIPVSVIFVMLLVVPLFFVRQGNAGKSGTR